MCAAAVDWTAVVVTCQTRDSTFAIQQELDLRQNTGVISANTIVLAVEDPQACVGSGGATLNALLVVAEHISAKHKYNVVNPDVLHNSRILIFHLGRQYEYQSCGRAFIPLPLKLPTATDHAILPTNLDVLFYLLTNAVAVDTPPGVWVCSTDMLLHVPLNLGGLRCNEADVCVLSVPGSVEYATRHGVYKVSHQGEVEDILYQGNATDIEKCYISGTEEVPLVAGVVYISAAVAETMLSFHTSPPLDACTYMGIDSGAEPIQLSLFFDLLLAMCCGVTELDFVSGSRSGKYGRRTNMIEDSTRLARQHIWKALRGYKVHMCYVPEGRHLYLDDSAPSIIDVLTEYTRISSLKIVNKLHTYIEAGSNIDKSSYVYNSYIGAGCSIGRGCVISGCYFTKHVQVDNNCLLQGINIYSDEPIHICNDTALLGIHIHDSSTNQPKYAMVTWTLSDKVTKKCVHDGTICAMSLEAFCDHTGIQTEDLWNDDMAEGERSLYNARLYRVYDCKESASLQDIVWIHRHTNYDDIQNLKRWRESERLTLEDILKSVDYRSEFFNRRSMFHTVSVELISDTLLQSRDEGLNALYATAITDKQGDLYLARLDHIASTCGKPSIAARTLANIADVLGTMAHNAGGLRSGPAGNKQWATSFKLLEQEDISGGVKALTEERHHWLSRPELLVRAARHYEGAAQILIRHAVMTARQFIKTTVCECPGMGQWVMASCPARIDIAGGWSDTPPITYEHGGAVINAAVAIDGQRPIGAKVRRVKEAHLVLSIVNCGETQWSMTVTDSTQLADYTNPQAPGALLKAALCCAEIVTCSSDTPLADQLTSKYGGGFELQTWSNLKHGSGLGTSSILAGVLMAALWRASGKMHDTAALNHGVSHLEQMMTTGGGWQDTVGGLTGGIKVGHSKAELPLKIETTYPRISEEVIRAFSDRLVLVYTGKTRLARNLLQNVLRNWYARNPEIVQIIDDLVTVAWDCAQAFEQGDLEAVGECMNHYWCLKKQIAPGSEPLAVTEMMDVLRPHAHGLCLAGAGGGGYMYVLMKETGAVERVKDILSNLQGVANITVHDGTIDMEGLQITIAA